MKTKIFNELIKLSVPCDVSGFGYLMTAIQLVLSGSNYLKVTVNLYPEIARIYNTKPSRVDRAIRHAIKNAINEQDETDVIKYFGKHKSITNALFIATVANRVMLDA